MIGAEALSQAGHVIAAARRQGAMLTVAESCTGGLLGASLTAIDGASACFGQGYILYSNAAKEGILEVGSDLIARHGAVSAEVAAAMAAGALRHAGADLAVAVTGIAGPAGSTPDKPVGRVYIACAPLGDCDRHDFGAIGRDGVRQSSVLAGLRMLARALAAGHSGVRPHR